MDLQDKDIKAVLKMLKELKDVKKIKARLREGGEGVDGGWDVWIASQMDKSLIKLSRSLVMDMEAMGSQRLGHD